MFGRLSLKILPSEKSVQRWCPNSCTMTTRIGLWTSVRMSSSVLKVNRTCWGESSQVMSRGSSEEFDTAKAEESKRVQSQSLADRILWCVAHCSLGALFTAPDVQPARLQRNPAAFVEFRAREEARIVAGQRVAATLRKRACSQHPERPTVPGWEERRHAGAASLLPWLGSVWFFSSFLNWRNSSKGLVLKMWKTSSWPWWWHCSHHGQLEKSVWRSCKDGWESALDSREITFNRTHLIPDTPQGFFCINNKTC